MFYANTARFLHSVSGGEELPTIELSDIDEESMNRLLSVLLEESPAGIAKLLGVEKLPTNETNDTVSFQRKKRAVVF